MPRLKKQHLKKRKDGRYCCKYRDMQFMGWTEEEALQAREAYKAMEARSMAFSDTVEGYGRKWLNIAHPDVAESTRNQMQIHLNKLFHEIGGMRLPDVKPSDIKSIYSIYYSKLSKSYINSAKQVYAAMFDAAMEDGMCRINPVRQKSARPHKGTVGGHRAITDQEREWILTYCTDHRAYPAVMAMLYAGIRPQEAKALVIDQSVDFDAGTVTLRQFAHLDGSNHYAITNQGKTPRAARTIPLFTPLRHALKGKHGYLVQSSDGNPVTIQAWKSCWESYVHCMETAINGCEERWYGKKKDHKGKSMPPFIHFSVKPYDLRHSFCTMCRDHGVELNTCVKWMGHADAKMILHIYDEVSDNRSEKEAEKLENSLFRMPLRMQIDSDPPETIAMIESPKKRNVIC